MPFYRYSRWDGTQQVFPIGEDDLMEQLSEELVTHGDISNALHSMAQRGLRSKFGHSVSGIQDMLQRLSVMRQGALDRYNLEHILDNIKQRLQDIVQAERRGIEKRLADARSRFASTMGGENNSAPTHQETERLLQHLDEMACRNQEFLDKLPQQPAQAIQQLKEYELFVDHEARDKFSELLKSLQQQVLDSSFRNLSQNLNSVSLGQLTSLKDMLRELNRLLEEYLSKGEAASRPYFDRFMQRYGKLFGSSPPASVEELAENLHWQVAQMESLLKSLSPELRRELEETLDSIFHDEELRDELARFASKLEHMRPDGTVAEEFLFRGNEPLSLEKALEVMHQLQKMEELERQLRRTQQEHHLDNVKPELMRELMGEESYQELEQLRCMAEVLENAGSSSESRAAFSLPPKA